jgi:hypothetical protein
MSEYEIEIPMNQMSGKDNRRLLGKKFLLDAVDLALEDTLSVVDSTYATNPERMSDRLGVSNETDTWLTAPEATIRYSSPMVDIEVTVKETPQLDFVVSGPQEITITLQELHDSTHECPVCGEELDCVLWENTRKFDDGTKEARWKYGCPADCDGAVIIETD